jgi:hypothetical protein
MCFKKYFPYFFNLFISDNSKRSPIADNYCTDTGGHTWMIVGIIFGLLSAVLSGYAVYVTILLRRTNIRKGKTDILRIQIET